MTISDTRSEADDTSGSTIRKSLVDAGHEIVSYAIVRDEPQDIRRAVLDGSPQAVICNGGTGLARRDTTFETISAMLEREIPGFGELFRMLSYRQVGSAAMLSRATAGMLGDRVVFSLPGSTKAVALAMDELIVPQLGHVVGLNR